MLSRRRSVILGSHRIDWDLFASFINEFSTSTLMLQSRLPPAVFLCQQSLRLQDNMLLGDLNALLMQSERAHCSECRDHLYGLLGMAPSSAAESPVNYETPLSQILIGAVEYFNTRPFGLFVHIDRELLFPTASLSRLFRVKAGPVCESCTCSVHGGSIWPTPSNYLSREAEPYSPSIDQSTYTCAFSIAVHDRLRWHSIRYTSPDDLGFFSNGSTSCGLCGTAIFSKELKECTMIKF